MNRNNYGSFLNDTTSSVNIDDVVRALRLQFVESLTTQPIYVSNLELKLGQSDTGFGGRRFWFLCPLCSTRVGKIYIHQGIAACRHCFGVDYRSHRFKGMIEAEGYRK